MPIDFDNKVAFIHVPKVAGTSIEVRYGLNNARCLYSWDWKAYCVDGVQYAPQHLTPALLSTIVPDFDAYTSFCFVRHPYAKMVSEYYFLHVAYYKKPIRIWSEWHFRRWLERTASKKDMDHLLPQNAYATGCQHVWRLEELPEKIETLDRWFHFQGNEPLGHHKKANHTAKRTQGLKQKTKDLIYELYREDFEALSFKR